MKRRHGFTLVELLVSMALIIFIMAILSQAFVAALGTFRNLKAQGDMAEKLRSTMQVLQHDLAADHFDGGRRLSDPTFWSSGPPQQGFFQIYEGPPTNPLASWLGTMPVPVGGFPQIYQGAPLIGSTPGPLGEGPDLTGIASYRSINHCLSFTVKLRGNDMGDFMSASALGSGNVWTPPSPLLPNGAPLVPQLPGNPAPSLTAAGLGIGAIQTFGPPESRYQPITGALVPNVTGYNYQWAAVAWFMQPQMNPTTLLQETTTLDPSNLSPPVPLYTLYRRQAMLVPDNNLVALSTTPIGGIPTAQIGYFAEMSCMPDINKLGTLIYFNNPSDITLPSNRFWGGQGPFPLPLPPATPFIPPDMPPYLPIPPTPLGILPAAPLGLLRGSDIQLNDVISFDVRILEKDISKTMTLPPALGGYGGPDPFVTLHTNYPGTVINVFQQPTPLLPTLPPPLTYFTLNNPLYYNPVNPANLYAPAVFDTWSNKNNGIVDYSQWNQLLNPNPTTSIPLWNGFKGPTIQAIQITIRIWDFKTNQTRQVTIVQAM